MNAAELHCVCRVRLAVLREIVAAGGQVRPAQVARAIAPVAGHVAAEELAGSLLAEAVVSETERKKKRGRRRSRVKRVF